MDGAGAGASGVMAKTAAAEAYSQQATEVNGMDKKKEEIPGQG